MLSVPKAAEPLVSAMSCVFTRPTFERFRLLMIGAILTGGRHCLSQILWSVLGWSSGHWTDFYRVFSRAPWSMWPLAHVLAAAVLQLIPASKTVYLVFDDTLCRHSGPKVYARGNFRDSLRSTKTANVFSHGHRWLVVSILFKPPLVSRYWALPVLTAMCRTPQQDKADKRRHKTDVHLARLLTRTLARWFPQRRFQAIGDGEYGRRDLARDLLDAKVTMVARLPAHAALYDDPPAAKGRGRPRQRGKKQRCPREAIKGKRFRAVKVRWADGSLRSVKVYSAVARWSRPGHGFVPIRWVCVRQEDGHEHYLFSTDLSLTVEQIVGTYSLRWSIEVTFQLCREHLGLESPRQRAAKSVERMTPCLFGLFTLVTLIYAASVRGRTMPEKLTRCSPWYTKAEPTFSDAMAHVRGLFIKSIFFAGPSKQGPATFARHEKQTRWLLGLARAA